MKQINFHKLLVDISRSLQLACLLLLVLLSCKESKNEDEYEFYMENIVDWDLQLEHLKLHIHLPIELELSNYQRFSFTNKNNYAMSYPAYFFSVDELSNDKLQQYLENTDFPIEYLAERFLGDTTNIPPAFHLLMYADARRIHEYQYLYQSEVEQLTLPSGLNVFIRSMEFNTDYADHFYIFTTFSYDDHHYLLQCIFAAQNASYYYSDWLKILNNLTISAA